VAADQFVFFVSGLIGFGPSVAVLFHALRTYDYPHTEKAYFDTGRVFLALAVGMVLGTASGALTVALQQGVGSLLALVIVLLLLALFEEGFKVLYLNRKGYRGRFDTTFVGLTLGVGIASIVAAGSALLFRRPLPASSARAKMTLRENPVSTVSTPLEVVVPLDVPLR